MRRQIGLKYILVVLACIFLAHLGTVILANAVFSREYDRTERLINPRIFPDEQRAGIIWHFIKTRLLSRPGSIVILGDSQTFGTGRPYENSFSAVLRGDLASVPVLNISGIDFSFADNGEVVSMLTHSGAKPAVIVTNINVSRYGAEATVGPRRLPRDVSSESSPLIPLAQMTPWRLRRVVEESNAEPRGNEFQYISLGSQFLVPADADRRAIIDRELTDLLVRLADAAPRVIAFTSPIALKSMSRYGFDADQVREIGRHAYSVCSAVAAKRPVLRCVDWVDALDVSDFIDVLHFNDAGHRKMAAVLLEALSNR